MMLIRRATLKDSAFVAMYLLSSMEDIVCQFIGENDHQKAMEFMLYLAERERNQYSYQNCWVAENESGVVAAVNLYDGSALAWLREPVLDYLRSRFNRNFIPDEETQDGEYYIDSLGVHPDHRCKGIGSLLLQSVINEYVHNQGHTLGLLVDEENPAARRFYLRLGFQTAGRKLLFGKVMEHLQFKSGT